MTEKPTTLEILPPEEEGTEPERALVPRPEIVSPEFRYQVVTSLAEMKEIFQAHRQLLREVMEPGIDFGPIPGTTTDRTLFKAGAEKLQILHAYAHEMHKEEEILDWDAPFFHYRYRCDIYDRRTGSLVGQAYGSCNSAESKYAYRWVTEKKVPADLDIRLLPKRKNRRGWWVYRIPNPDLPDLVNTIDKMAQKRAFVGAVRLCTGASGLFAEEGVPPGDGERGAPTPEVEGVEEEREEEPKDEPKEESKPNRKRSGDGKLDTLAKLLFNKANAALQEAGLAAYYTTSDHVKNTLAAEGLKEKQILATSEKSLINLLVKHAKEAGK